ncbi:MAG: terminase small subunit [Gallionella sp.]|nr:terminase small subunit [Gallionella sp.]
MEETKLNNTPSWEEAMMAPELTLREKDLRDRFVTEYLKDSNYVTAAIRVGFGPSFAAEYATKFSAEPYVQQQIAARKNEPAKQLTDDERKKLVEAHLIRIFTDEKAPYSSQVAALSKFQDLHGMNAPTKKELSGPGGTPLMPTTLQVVFDDSPDDEQ